MYDDGNGCVPCLQERAHKACSYSCNNMLWTVQADFHLVCARLADLMGLLSSYETIDNLKF
jgi:hypothetical protein